MMNTFKRLYKRKFIQEFKYMNTGEDILIFINDDSIIHITNLKVGCVIGPFLPAQNNL
jgi:hypothetical protein